MASSTEAVGVLVSGVSLMDMMGAQNEFRAFGLRLQDRRCLRMTGRREKARGRWTARPLAVKGLCAAVGLFCVGVVGEDGEGAIELLGEDDAGQFVGHGE